MSPRRKNGDPVGLLLYITSERQQHAIRCARTRRGVSQENLAGVISANRKGRSWSGSTIGAIEKGGKRVSLLAFLDVCSELGLDPADITDGADQLVDIIWLCREGASDAWLKAGQRLEQIEHSRADLEESKRKISREWKAINAEKERLNEAHRKVEDAWDEVRGLKDHLEEEAAAMRKLEKLDDIRYTYTEVELACTRYTQGYRDGHQDGFRTSQGMNPLYHTIPK